MENFAPGLNQEDKLGTYFSLLPNELIRLIDIYYYHPLKIYVTSFPDIDPNEPRPTDYFLSCLMVGYCNGKINERISISFEISELLAILLDPIKDKYYPTADYLDISLTNMVQVHTLVNQTSLSVSTVISYIEILYDAYKTKKLIEKLETIKADIEKYLNRNLSAQEIDTLLEKYAY